jgi:DNA-binding transcriptional LysR family regulator
MTGIAAFVQAAEAGNFTEAAKRMHLSRSAVGKTVARLEERLGVRLFHRTTRQQSLTEDGQAFYERCVRALSELEAAEAALDSGRREPRGCLRVTAPVLFGRHCVAPVLFRLARKHPQLELEVAFSDHLIDLVEEHFDLAVRIGGLPDSASLAARRLGTQRMAICAAPSYLARHGRPASIEDFEHHDGIVYSRAGHGKRWSVTGPDGHTHDLRVKARLRLDDVQSIVDAAVSGAGLAWLPCWMFARQLRAGELELVMDSDRVLATEIHAVWPRALHLPSKTRLAIDALAAEIPALIG